jgi:hypothetical protein
MALTDRLRSRLWSGRVSGVHETLPGGASRPLPIAVGDPEQSSLQLNGHPRPNLVLDWREIGGPSVVAPAHSGFGTSTIRDLIPYEFGGTVDLAFAPSGVRCRLELPADWLINNNEPLSQTSQTAAKLPGR